MSKIISQRLTELGLRLPEPPIPCGEYVSAVVHEGIAYVSGQVSRAELARHHRPGKFGNVLVDRDCSSARLRTARLERP
jgi:enamine deaminase RidA (YjgF/YER057c/UK114 family)